MNSAAKPDPESEPTADVDPLTFETPVAPTDPAANPDPITGEPGAHPVGVGVGALGAGMAGAAIGAFGGPIGMLIGAAVGAVAGGLAGHEVAATAGDPAVDEPAATVSTPLTADESPATRGAVAPATDTAARAMESGFRAMSVPAAAVPAAVPVRRPAGGATAEFDKTGDAGAFSHAPLEGDATPQGGSYFTATSVTGLEAPSVPEEIDLAAGTSTDTEYRVRLAAYFLYLDRSAAGQPGDALGDWLKAERGVYGS